MKRYLLLLIMSVMTLGINAQFSVKSPDKNTEITLSTFRERRGKSKMVKASHMHMTIKFLDKEWTVVEWMEVGLVVKNKGRRYNFGRMEIKKADTSYAYDPEEFKDSALLPLKSAYKSLVLDTGQGIKLEVRAYNDGVAYRYFIESFDGKYELLDMSRVYPQERSWAVIGTFEGDCATAWHVLEKDRVFKPYEEGGYGNKQEEPAAKVIPWRDALSTLSVGASFNWYSRGSWKEVSQRGGVLVDATYKYLYGGIGFSPCQSMTYIYYNDDLPAFKGVIGRVHAWDISGRFGFNLPIQSSFSIYTVSPYLVSSMTHMKMHDSKKGNNDITPLNHYAFGAGLKLQFSFRERLLIGLAYEYQKFHDDNAPKSMQSAILSLGFRY